MATIIGTLSVCLDCMLTEQQGEIPNDHPADQPEPWSALPSDVTPRQCVMGTEHGPLDADCSAQTEEDHYTDCGHDTFTHARCNGCGTYLPGERFEYVIFDH